LTTQGKDYMSDEEAKIAILEIGKRMYNKGFVAANDGNISCKVDEHTIWITPTGVSKGYMTEDMLVKMSLEGKIISSKYKPSSEVKMHIKVYQENPKIKAVVHAHSPIATSFAVAGISLDIAILPEAVIQVGTVPVAHYATPGTDGVADSIAPYCRSHNSVLLANHGVLSWDEDVYSAFQRMETIEHYAQIFMYSNYIIGKPRVLSHDQIDELIELREKLGITAGGRPQGVAKASNMEDVIDSGLGDAK
jgi:L-fuculose-phosphate aldolase